MRFPHFFYLVLHVAISFAQKVTWYVAVEGEVTAATFLLCGYYLPDAGATTCIAAALVSGIRVGISQGNNYGVTEAPLTAPRRAFRRELLRLSPESEATAFDMVHIGMTGNHTFLNTEDMIVGWNTILLPGNSFDLKARRLADNRTQISTVGLSASTLLDPASPPDNSPIRPRQSRVYKEEELVMTHNWPTGFGSTSTNGLDAAANGAAGYVANAPQGSYSFCSTVYSPTGLAAQVAFSFSGDYAPDNPPPCYA